MDVRMEAGWKQALQTQFDAPYFARISEFLHTQLRNGVTIYPPARLLFNAFDQTPFHALKVVLLGQDPYHQPGQAHGLSFSVPKGVNPPPSLRTVYTELYNDLGIAPPNHGCLEDWAHQGVLLLNAALSVEAGKPTSHSQIGWMTFTDAVIKTVSDQKEHIVFLLWGNFARSKRTLIDTTRHCVLEAAHPSPLARGAFYGSRPFSQTNQYLESHGISPIDWHL